jgi:ABC-type uncharacterized transport system substrate-binding protein
VFVRSALRTSAAVFIFLAASATRALAHPHAWLENSVRAHFAGSRLTRLDLHWRFDEVFSEDVLRFIKHDPAQALLGSDVASLNRKAFTDLKEYGYFTHLRSGERPVTDLQPRGFPARMDGRRLVYDFSLVPAEPVDASAAPLTAAFYDPTYYVDVALVSGTGLVIHGDARCKAQATPDVGHTIYNGFVTPIAARFSCTR